MTRSKNTRKTRGNLKTRHADSQPQGPKQPSKASFLQQSKRGGLIVSDELEKALAECKARVADIAADCRRKNRKFRDIEFDLENDKYRCLHGLFLPGDELYTPSDIRRATQIFDKPSFFVDGADSNDIIQGGLGDCWFLSALATMSTWKGLVEKFCVARDELVGVYGFIFFRDTTWVTVIIDDLLYTSIPKFEELSPAEAILYHHNKDQYNASARRGGKSLYFAKSGTNGETWVPLIEKAFAKLHGSFAALNGGKAGEAIEDLTGGVTSFISTKDILDPDEFWAEELLHANTDRLFGCAFGALSSVRSGNDEATVNGLMGGHAYSVLRAVEYRGRRFVVIRNPWGQSEWTGPWSDGSKEWTPEWLPALEALGHRFGDDGEFVMEYKDFLESWEQVDRTLLFDSSWIMSSQWLKVTARPLPAAWAHGDVSFTLTIPSATSAVIVLSQLDARYFRPLAGNIYWSFDFVVFRKGETRPITTSNTSLRFVRSVNAEVALEAGEYVVHVRLDRVVTKTPADDPEYSNSWDPRTVSRILTERTKSQSIASNFNKSVGNRYLSIPLETLAGQDLSEMEAKATAAAEAMKKEQEALKRATSPKPTVTEDGNEAPSEATTPSEDSKDTPTTALVPVEEPKEEPTANGDGEKVKVIGDSKKSEANGNGTAHAEDADHAQGAAPGGDVKAEKDDDENDDEDEDKDKGTEEDGDNESNDDNASESGDENENEFSASFSDGNDPSTHPPKVPDNVVYLGLRVYTNKDAPAKIGGQLRHEMATSFAGLAVGQE